ncbi:heavy metal translocating P-type ATPase [Pseudochryseolinea flava]|uniref:Heavy metal translocating P-type ATPase n=1 Tax=Pseudochryseolinea flava TaxID=2059302 RepID=A0A364Y5V1_9BACT|nr:heavy metal translocating P-type ATPase metal-binding domain-containing protein [Pseudochryseolinea flava]RAW02376.1 heavy metal translocating P-type ATPase [Pseudochryseolinea flava]
MATEVTYDLVCFHCGQQCEDETQWFHDKPFCCQGCMTVYEILDTNNLCTYYTLDQKPGTTRKQKTDETYGYLDDADAQKKLLTFQSPTFAKVTFFVPAIHCTSCIWLLENLHKLSDGVIHSEVVFGKKSVTIDYNPEKISLAHVADLIASVGYAPKITLAAQHDKKSDNTLATKVAIAGFCFGNVMLFSFPEYLGIDHNDAYLMRLFSKLNLALAIPVLFYSGIDYLTSAFKSFKQKQINIDVPIAAGLIALFARSSYDIITATGPGYLDSFTGLVFFLLIGRWFQSKTYESLSFDRDFTSYFPLAVSKLEKDGWKPTVVHKLKQHDQIRIRNMELVPADSILLDSHAYIDYSFVTGESKPVKVKQAELVYAGGRLIGTPVTLVVEKSTSQSHLTSLWNNDAFKKTEESQYQKVIDRAARKFTWIVLGIAIITATYWYITYPSQMWLVLTSVLMVACPCALALAAPFTLGSMLRVAGRNKLYLKNADIIERMASIDTVVFDKTGTVTHGSEPTILIDGKPNEYTLACIKTLTSFSTHPLSSHVTNFLHQRADITVDKFKELPGKGIEAFIDGRLFKIGSATFTGITEKVSPTASHVFVSIDGQFSCRFSITTAIRKDIGAMIKRLGSRAFALLSGDHDHDKEAMRALFGADVELHFNQSPQEKLEHIKNLQAQGRKVMMIGDGLNDSGALKQSDVGIAISDNQGVFTPACDGILLGEQITSIDKMLRFSRKSSSILRIGFGISFFYNAIALSFAVTGNLTPLVAAIIMPISSISVVGFSTLAVRYAATKTKMN